MLAMNGNPMHVQALIASPALSPLTIYINIDTDDGRSYHLQDVQSHTREDAFTVLAAALMRVTMKIKAKVCPPTAVMTMIRKQMARANLRNCKKRCKSATLTMTRHKTNTKKVAFPMT